MNGWISVFSDSFAPGVEMRKQILDDAQIPCVVLNRQDSSYSGIGFASIKVELLVPIEFIEKAKVILQL
ncbi:MAG: putative signal transducing protein [Flavobacteriales bacterium]|jgi:hypothetical protein|tara:strand:- start:325 stop:531 length:207 start_codon:yes stop_codon:yes gene_type:complete